MEIPIEKKGIKISKIGLYQSLDIAKSPNGFLLDPYTRICSVIDYKGKSNIGDRVTERMSQIVPLTSSHWHNNMFDQPEYYRNHYVVQVPECPFACYYCYVDKPFVAVVKTPKELVFDFLKHKIEVYEKYGLEINVLHLMGGDPAIYSHYWPEIRKNLDDVELHDVILYSDCLMVEELLYGIQPWKHIPKDRFVLACNIKGPEERRKLWIDTKIPGEEDCIFKQILTESMNYIDKPNVYFTTINNNKEEIKFLQSLYGENRLDILKIHNYISSTQTLY